MTNKCTYRGRNLKAARLARYKYMKHAWQDFVNHGCSISYDRYRALEGGAYPTEKELRQISQMLRIEPIDWLFGHDMELPAHCDTLAGLPPKLREVIKSMIVAGSEQAKQLGLWE